MLLYAVRWRSLQFRSFELNTVPGGSTQARGDVLRPGGSTRENRSFTQSTSRKSQSALSD